MPARQPPKTAGLRSQTQMQPLPPDHSASFRPDVAGAVSPRAPVWATLAATFLGIGNMRPGPGTWASAATALLWAVLAYALPTPARAPLQVGLSILAILLGIPAATRVA